MQDVSIIKLGDYQINETIKYWQNKLSLRDWTISWEMLKDADIPGDCYAVVSWNLSYRSAHIKLSDPTSWASYCDPTDMEETIVHEMIHITTAPICDKAREIFTEQEQTVFLERPTDMLSCALVRLRRIAEPFEWEIPDKTKKKKRKKKS